MPPPLSLPSHAVVQFLLALPPPPPKHHTRLTLVSCRAPSPCLLSWVSETDFSVASLNRLSQKGGTAGGLDRRRGSYFGRGGGGDRQATSLRRVWCFGGGGGRAGRNWAAAWLGRERGGDVVCLIWRGGSLS
ncbi:hypothetical protein Droror1_Dr00000593 [Drosera rotundifolia]